MPANIDERDEMGLDDDKSVDDGDPTLDEGIPESAEDAEPGTSEEAEDTLAPEAEPAEEEPKPEPVAVSAPASAPPAAAIPEWAERIISDLHALKLESSRSQPAAPPAPADPWGEDFEGALAEAMNDSSGRKFKTLIRSLAKQEVEEVRNQLGGVANEMVVSRWRAAHPHLTPHEKDVAALVAKGLPLEEASELVEARSKVGRWAPAPAPTPVKPTAPSLDQQRRMVEQRRSADGPRPTRKPQGVVVERQVGRDTRADNVGGRRFDLTKRGFLSDLAELRGKIARGGGDED